MAFYVYIIQSLADDSYYKGFSEDPLRRLFQHNNSGSRYTAAKLPWKLVHLEQRATKREALVREKVLKKYSQEQIRQLIDSTKNQLAKYMEGIGG